MYTHALLKIKNVAPWKQKLRKPYSATPNQKEVSVPLNYPVK